MTRIPNPFTPFQTARRPAKILLFGEPGTEKTRRALLQMPHPIAYIDMEASAAVYGELAAPEDALLVTRRIRGTGSVIHALDFLEEHPNDFESIVIDPITTIWEQLQAAFRERLAIRKSRREAITAEDVVIEPGHWNALNTTHGELIARLLSMPQHVLLVGRGKWHKDEDTGKINGYDFEGWKRVPSLVSTVIETHPDYDFCHKDRFGVYKEGRHKRIDLSLLTGAAGHDAQKVEGEREAARADGDEAREARQKAVDHLIERGLLQEALEEFGAAEEWDRKTLDDLREWLRVKHPMPVTRNGGRSAPREPGEDAVERRGAGGGR